MICFVLLFSLVQLANWTNKCINIKSKAECKTKWTCRWGRGKCLQIKTLEPRTYTYQNFCYVRKYIPKKGVYVKSDKCYKDAKIIHVN